MSILKVRFSNLLSRISLGLSLLLAMDINRHPNHSSTAAAKRNRLKFAVCGTLIFLTALGIRFLHWQDNNVEHARVYSAIMKQGFRYKREALQMIEGHSILFPAEHDPEDGRMLLHPPGYAILMRALYGNNLYDHTYNGLRIGQVIADSFAAALLFLIVIELLPSAIAIIAGLLVALSPQLAYYPLWLTPDSLCVVPILLSVYLLVRAVKRPRLLTIVSSGVMIGLSCWLRSNAIMLAPFLALVAFLLFERGERLRYSTALLISTVVVIGPITIHNYLVFHRLVPLSLATGINLIEGIAEYDVDDRFGMPHDDREAKADDAKWYGRPDYADNPWHPDGIDRDHWRIERGLGVIRSNPGWFLGVMFRRALLFLTYNGPRSHEDGFYTPPVFAVSTKPAFNHRLEVMPEAEPLWSSSPGDLLAGDTIVDPDAKASLIDSKRVLEVTTQEDEAVDLFESAPIDVQKHTDYVLVLSIKSAESNVDFRVTSVDRSMILESARYEQDDKEERTQNPVTRDVEPANSSDRQPIGTVHVSFASGDLDRVCLVISKKVESPAPVTAEVEQAKLFMLGATPYAWTRYPRAVVHFIQRNAFSTAPLLTLFALGIALLVLGRRFRELLIVLAVPIYYLCSHAPFRTHFRYVLPIHYFIFVTAAVSLYVAAIGIRQVAKR